MAVIERWEYLVKGLASIDTEALNLYGRAGWELVSLAPPTAAEPSRAIFKRPKEGRRG